MPKKKVAAKRASRSAAEEGEGPAPASTKTSIVVNDNEGNYVRTYSLEEHGEGYKELAAQFAAKKGYSL